MTSGATVLLAVLCASTPLLAQEDLQAAEDVRVLTPAYLPDFSRFAPPRGSYTYAGSWQGIPAVTIDVTVEQDERHYRIVTTVRTHRGIDLFYKLRHRAEGLISSFDLLPERTVVDQRENSRIRQTRISFTDDGTITAVRSQVGGKTTALAFRTGNFTLDPFSAAFLARCLDWRLGETREFDVFSGKSRYLIRLTAAEKTTLRLGGEEREVWVVIPRVENLTSRKQNKKFKGAKIYVTADREREIVRITSEVMVGSIAVEMVSFTPSGLPAPAVRTPHRRDGAH